MRITGLPNGEEIMITGRIMWRQSLSVTNRQTDGRTGGQIYGDSVVGSYGALP